MTISPTCLALPCLALPGLALSCLALPCLALPCLALHCIALQYTVLCWLHCIAMHCMQSNTHKLGFDCGDRALTRNMWNNRQLICSSRWSLTGHSCIVEPLFKYHLHQQDKNYWHQLTTNPPRTCYSGFRVDCQRVFNCWRSLTSVLINQVQLEINKAERR